MLRAHFPCRPRAAAIAEYGQLPVAVKAAVAARLTTDLLEVPPRPANHGLFNCNQHSSRVFIAACLPVTEASRACLNYVMPGPCLQ